MRKIVIWMMAAFLLFQLAACAPDAKQEAQEQMELGEKYLTEENYEEAIVAFTKVIELDPKAERAYLGIADAYKKSGESGKAVDILENGYAQVPGDEIKTELLGLFEARAEEAWNGGDFGEAEAAYLRMTELEPHSIWVYLSLYDLYTETGEEEKRKDILEKGLSVCESLPENGRTEEEEAGYKALKEARELLTRQETVSDHLVHLRIPFTVDEIELDVSGIGEAKAVYGGRPYAESNLMNDGTQDTVYVCFGMNDTPIPPGYQADEFGFIFSAPAGGGGIEYIGIQDPAFTCLGAIHVGDPRADAFRLFGVPEPGISYGTLDCRAEDGRTLKVWFAEDGFSIIYTASQGEITVSGDESGIIHSINLITGGQIQS